MQAEQRQPSQLKDRPESSVRRPEPEAPNGAAQAQAEREPEPKRRGSRPFLILAVLLVVVLGGIGTYLLVTAGQESTDDAQVAADLVPIGARVAGQVVRVAIREDQLVKKGDLIAQIDDADYTAKVKQAEAELASARAQAAQADAQVDIVTATSKGTASSAKAAFSGSSVGVASADAQVAAARADLVRAQAESRKADLDLRRAKELREANAIPQERLDNAQAAYDSAQAALSQAQAQVAAAEEGRRAAQARVSEAAGRVTQTAPIDAQIAAAKANSELAHARVQSAEAALGLAQLQLSYTKIVAPADGRASKLSVHEGQLVGVGQAIVELVPTKTYVLANFKETQMGSMAVGQRAKLEIDAYPHREFEGKVESISGGTGASFSLLPADNASGNFVKVVQRVPVRIAWVNPPTDVALRAGLSVTATVYVGK
jgi:membrane fusion protein (multidrug efflux system)